MNKRQYCKQLINEIKSYHPEQGDILILISDRRLSDRQTHQLKEQFESILKKAGNENLPVVVLDGGFDIKVIKSIKGAIVNEVGGRKER